MRGFVKTVLYNEGTRLFVFIFIGMLLMVLIQLEMTPISTAKIASFSADSTQNKPGVVIQGSIGRIPLPSDRAVTGRSPSPTSTAFRNTPAVNISKQNNSRRVNLGDTTQYLLRPQIKGNSMQKDFKRNEYGTRKHFCTDTSKWSETLSSRLGHVTSHMKSWKFSHTVECPYFNVSEVKYDQLRLKLSLNCNKMGGLVHSLTWTDNTSDIYSAPFGNECVDNFIQQCCRGSHRVPNVVHYVWYMRGELTFVGFTSLLAVIRFVNPCAIIFHGDNIPHGKYWDFIVNISPNIIHLKRDRPTIFSGQKIKHREHSSDIMRIEALIRYGGIYMDTDTVIVKSLEPLRHYPCVMSNQSSGLMASAFVMAEKNASFLQLWMDGYRYHYNSSKYTYNAMVYPKRLALEHRHLIHVEYATISRPKNMIGGKIYYNEYATYDWSYIYGIHLYSRIYKKPFNENTIRNMNTTVGSISRHVVYGNKELCN